MKVVSISGYGATGASVVTDYLREFEGVSTLKSEFQLIQEPDGIEDLKYFLCKSKSRIKANSAVKRFLKNINSPKHQIFLKKNKKEFKKLCHEYIDYLQLIEWKGYSSFESKDISKKSNFGYFLDRCLNRINKALHIKRRYPCSKKRYFGMLDEADFDKCTKAFLEKVFEMMGLNKDVVALEQAFSSFNPQDSFVYFNDACAIVVKRDIRDVFCETNIAMSWENRYIPCWKNLDKFIQCYHMMEKEIKQIDDRHVLYLSFEEIVMNGESELKKIRDFIGIDGKNHVSKGSHFKKEVSSKNVGIHKKYPEFAGYFDRLKEEFPDLIYEN